MILHESGENYLEAILQLRQAGNAVRSIDIATHFGFSKPSVSRAMGILKNEHYITIDDSGYIHLTETGSAVANKILERHQLLAQYLVALGVDETIALQDACRIEHVISEQSFEKIKQHAEGLHLVNLV